MAWAHDQDHALRRGWLLGHAVKQIAHDVGKCERAVHARRAVLKLPPRKLARKNGGEVRTRVHAYLSAASLEKAQARALARRQTLAGYLKSLVMRDIGG